MEAVIVVKQKTGVGYKIIDIPQLKPYFEVGYEYKDCIHVRPREDKKPNPSEYYAIYTLEYPD